MAVYRSNSRLDLLPTELFPAIIDNLGLDLIAHVYFAKLHKRVTACYDGRGQDFWEPILRASGIGAFSGESLSNSGWALLAYECAEHAASCRHPLCGLTRLRENEMNMQKHLDTGFDIMYAVSSDLHEIQPPVSYKAIPIPIWQEVTFRGATLDELTPAVPCFRKKDARGRPDFGEDLAEHPILWRSFATFSPVVTMYLFAMCHDVDPTNENGVTVADLLHEVMTIFGQPTSNNRFSDVMLLVQYSCKAGGSDMTEIFPDTWTSAERFRALTTMTDWFHLVHWVGLDFQIVTSTSGHMYEARYEKTDLPSTYSEYCANLCRFFDASGL